MSARLQAIVEQLLLRPGYQVLEIGCGQGVAGRLICDRLGTDGRYLGIDRSARMVALARRQLATEIRDGRAAVLQADFATFDPGARRYDCILAVRVRPFFTDRSAAEALVRPWLRPGGRLHVVYDEPPPRQTAR